MYVLSIWVRPYLKKVDHSDPICSENNYLIESLGFRVCLARTCLFQRVFADVLATSPSTSPNSNGHVADCW
jgi:hypothetical protein